MKEGFLCVANWDSNVGYAWWLMESFWVKIASEYSTKYDVYVAYPSISKLPESIASSTLVCELCDFGPRGFLGVLSQIKFIRKNKIKIIYFSDKRFADWRYVLYRVFGVRKIIVHDHTPGLRTKPVGVKRIYKTIRARVPFMNCDLMIGATEFVRQRCIDVYKLPERKCFSAPNGIPDKMHEKKTLDISLPSNRCIIVTVGRASEYKGIYFALSVINKLVVDCGCKNILYLWVGDGPEFESVKKRVSDLDLEDYVLMPGRIEDVVGLLRECDIGFHPSKGEVGYSLSILEMMQQELPVVTSDNPSVSEATIHGENGLIYKEGDIDDACSCLMGLIRDRSRRQLFGENARKDVLRKYGLQNTHHQLIKVITDNI